MYFINYLSVGAVFKGIDNHFRDLKREIVRKLLGKKSNEFMNEPRLIKSVD